MKKIWTVVPNRLGVHMRPSLLIAKTVEPFASRVNLVKGEQVADAKSFTEVLSLAMQQGDFVEIRAEGPDEDNAILALAALFKKSFTEENIYD
jgi:phosphocarrier protein HPr